MSRKRCAHSVVCAIAAVSWKEYVIGALGAPVGVFAFLKLSDERGDHRSLRCHHSPSAFFSRGLPAFRLFFHQAVR